VEKAAPRKVVRLVPKPRLSAGAAIRAGLCPRCRDGKIFRGRMSMNPECPTCGLCFERESGYFLGAMYVSYALAVPLLSVLTAVVFFAAGDWPLEHALPVAVILFLPFVPAVFRWSRILYIHFDRWMDPDR
jgi:uncharacterized protein (DUF983 family)